MNASPGAARRRRIVGFGAIAVAATLLTSCAAGRKAQTIDQHPAIQGANSQLGSIAVRDLSIIAPTQGASYPAGSALRLTGVFVNNGAQSDLLTGITSSSITGWGAYSSISDADQVAAAAGGSAAGSASPEAPTSSVASSADASSPTPSSSQSTTVNNSPAASRSDTSGAATTPTAPATPSSTSPTASTPQASHTVRIPVGGRASFGVPDATGALLVLGTKARLYPGSTVTMTLTFARAGTVTVEVPVQITSNPTQSTVPPPSGETAEGD